MVVTWWIVVYFCAVMVNGCLTEILMYHAKHHYDTVNLSLLLVYNNTSSLKTKSCSIWILKRVVLYYFTDSCKVSTLLCNVVSPKQIYIFLNISFLKSKTYHGILESEDQPVGRQQTMFLI